MCWRESLGVGPRTRRALAYFLETAGMLLLVAPHPTEPSARFAGSASKDAAGLQALQPNLRSSSGRPHGGWEGGSSTVWMYINLQRTSRLARSHAPCKRRAINKLRWHLQDGSSAPTQHARTNHCGPHHLADAPDTVDTHRDPADAARPVACSGAGTSRCQVRPRERCSRGSQVHATEGR